MSNTSDYVLGVLRAMTESMKNKSRTPQEADQEFLKRVSRQQLESCLTDPGLDQDDVATIKEMLKYFFNYEVPIN